MKYLALILIVAATAAPAHAGTIEQQVRQAFAPYGQSDRAACIATHESHFQARAYFAGNYGVMQIAYRWHHEKDETVAHFAARMWRPAENIRLAVRIYLNRDRHGRAHPSWLPWSTHIYC